jgi:threonine dehydrogenase-like Zn-dependent dehydrogenase
VHRVGICGSELGGYLGHNSLRKPPLVMGHEFAGEIAAVSAGAALADGRVAIVGQRVTVNPLVTCGACEFCRDGRDSLCLNRQLIGAHRPGAMAERVIVPARNCLELPDLLSMTSGSLTEPLACAIRAVGMSALTPGRTLAILGAGPIGLLCLAVARRAGVCDVLVSDIAGSRLAVASAWGASATINGRDEDVVARCHAMRAGGVHTVIDAVGTDQTRAQAVAAVANGGTVVLIGLHAEASPLSVNVVIRREITLRGTFAYSRQDFADALTLLADGVGAVDASWLAEQPLALGKAAFDALVDGVAPAAKIVLTVP